MQSAPLIIGAHRKNSSYIEPAAPPIWAIGPSTPKTEPPLVSVTVVVIIFAKISLVLISKCFLVDECFKEVGLTIFTNQERKNFHF